MSFSCTERQLETLLDNFSDWEMDTDFLTLILVELGVKEGGLIHDWEQEEDFLERFLDTGLYVKPLPDREPFNLNPSEADMYLISRNPQRFDTVSLDHDDRERFARELGEFLGYPEEDVEWYIDEGMDDLEEVYGADAEKVEELYPFAMYYPSPDEESIRRAEEKATFHRGVLHQMDEEFGTDIGGRLIEELTRLTKDRREE